MATKAEPLDVKKLGIVTAHQLQEKLGVSQPTLSRWTKNAEILRLSHGFYVHPDYQIPPEELDFAIACAKFGPKSAIGGLSALYHYRLIDQPPAQVWLIVSPSKADRNRLYRNLRTKTTPKYGIDIFKFYRITNIERTVIEALKFAVKIGPRVAINAARKALQEGLTNEKKLGEMAKMLKLQSVLQKYWETIVS